MIPPPSTPDAELRQLENRARQRTFSYLVAWERRFGYTSVNEALFGVCKAQVDKILVEGEPDLVERFTAVYRRMRGGRRRTLAGVDHVKARVAGS